jgi:hypothetical protein
LWRPFFGGQIKLPEHMRLDLVFDPRRSTLLDLEGVPDQRRDLFAQQDAEQPDQCNPGGAGDRTLNKA